MADIARLTAAGKTLGVEIVPLTAGRPEEIEPALAAAKRAGIAAIVVQFPSTLVFAQQQRLAELLGRYGLPAAGWGDFAAQGGLLSYANDLEDIPYQTGIYVGRILNGTKPAELPVMQSTKTRFVINLKTANALGLAIPPALLARADEVIE
jgi:putative ABC transport system substrate-binding protein